MFCLDGFANSFSQMQEEILKFHINSTVYTGNRNITNLGSFPYLTARVLREITMIYFWSIGLSDKVILEVTEMIVIFFKMLTLVWTISILYHISYIISFNNYYYISLVKCQAFFCILLQFDV